MQKQINKILNEQVVNKLGKKFILSWIDEITYQKEVFARNEEEARKMFWDGLIDSSDEEDVVEGKFIEDSLEIEEVEE